MIEVNDVVQFIEKHKWRGCLGIVVKVKSNKCIIGIPQPQQGTVFILDDGSGIERIGKAVMVFDDADD